MTQPINEQARQVASRAIQEKPASLDSSRASSLLGPDKPASTVRKWFPTGHLAWCKVHNGKGLIEVPNFYDAVDNRRWHLVQELFEVEFGPGEDDARRTGRVEWRPIPILPSDAPVSTCAEIIIPAFDSTLINQAPNIAGPNQVPPAPG